jgi:STE24 endopeptidase
MKPVFVIFCCLLSFLFVKGQPIQPAAYPPAKYAARFDPQKAAIQLINTIPAAARAKANNYVEGGYWLLLWNFVNAAFVAWLFLFGGLSAYIKKIADKTSKTNRRNLVYIALYFLLSFLLLLPLDIYQNFIREQQYGFSNQNFIQWFLNDLLTFLVELIIAAPFFVLIYAIFRKVKENWWIWGGSISILFIIIILVIYPVFISPAFNNYTPIKNGALKDQILSMARANSVNIDQVYVYNESKQTKLFNANVSGFAGTARISLNDNMLNNCTNNEIKAALGHEMGHYVLNHLFILTMEFGILIIVGFKLTQWALNKLLLKYGGRWNVSAIQDIRSLPVLVFLFTFYFFILTPINNTIIRTGEIQADLYGLNAAREPDAIASYMIKSADNLKVAPGYWEEIFFFDHPCRTYRVLTAMKWKAENLDGK